jgi:hypothetical protein
MPAGQTTVGTIGKVAAGFGMALAIMLAAVPTRGQLNESAPIVVKKPKNSATPSKASWLKAEVIHADANSMIVREQANGMMLHTFTYTAGLQPQMQRVVDQGGYQYGDKVEILYQSGQTVALKVRGKPSKPL